MPLITAQVERLANGGLDEIRPLLPAHHEALGLFKPWMPLDPQYEAYLRRELTGELVYVTLRVDGKLAGYWISMVAPGFHYQSTLTATMDILWIQPEWRNRGASKLLHDTMEGELRRRGVKLWWAGSKSHASIAPWLESLGFEEAEVYLCKWIGEKTAPSEG